MALSAVYSWVVFASTFVKAGAIGPNYNAPGTDWMVMYAAADSALSGHLQSIFDGDRFTSHLNTIFANWLTQPLAFRPWVYPPSFLLILAPFAGLGFLGSYAAFQLVSAGLLIAALRYRADHAKASGWIALAACLSPAASINAVDGQCGFLVAALIVGAFRLAPTRPLIAGALVGLLTFKPQFGLLIPVALIAARQWRVAISAVLTALALFALSAAVFGMDAWFTWGKATLQGYLGGDPKWVEYGRMWGSSVYACAFLLGAPARLATAIQTFAIGASAVATWFVFRSRLRPDLKLATLLVATLIASPHWASYDGVSLVIAAGLWLADEPRPWPLWKGILALALWLTPLISPPLVVPFGRVIPLVLAGLVVVIVAKARGMTLAEADAAQTKLERA